VGALQSSAIANASGWMSLTVPAWMCKGLKAGWKPPNHSGSSSPHRPRCRVQAADIHLMKKFAVAGPEAAMGHSVDVAPAPIGSQD
jgi:hypothetical protein